MLNLKRFDLHNIRIFRLLSLWLENKADSEGVEQIYEKIMDIPRYKFIPILPQLVPHITNNPDDTFGQKINEIVGKEFYMAKHDDFNLV